MICKVKIYFIYLFTGTIVCENVVVLDNSVADNRFRNGGGGFVSSWYASLQMEKTKRSYQCND